MTINVLPQLVEVRVPALYLQAAQDFIVPPSAAAEMRQALPRLQVVCLEGPHGLLQAAPQAAAAAVMAFLARAQ
jgi:pimeloyl-[acyl-carrier protein] methyl ester esterase